jgi:hypothetical protein
MKNIIHLVKVLRWPFMYFTNLLICLLNYPLAYIQQKQVRLSSSGVTTTFHCVIQQLLTFSDVGN